MIDVELKSRAGAETVVLVKTQHCEESKRPLSLFMPSEAGIMTCSTDGFA